MKERTYRELPINRVVSLAGLALILSVCGPDWGTEPGLLSSRRSWGEASRRLEAGTRVQVRLVTSLSSGGSLPGEVFRARVERDVLAGEEIVVPRGSTVVGSVVEARSGREPNTSVRLNLDFYLLELPSGEMVPLAATLVRDPGDDGGSAMSPSSSDAGVAKPGGGQVVLPAGTLVTLELAEPVAVPRRAGRGSDRPRGSSR